MFSGHRDTPPAGATVPGKHYMPAAGNEKTKDIGKKTLHVRSGIWKDIGKYKTITTVNT